jgi:SpoVK/Ycf46/Vps4 family AAA+-type ATPase
MHPDRNPRRNRDADDIAQTLRELERFAAVMRPEDAKEPILIPALREEMINWLREMQYPEELAKVGLKPRKKVMLCGPPGCGKTTLAHHVAARMKMPLVSIQSEGIIDKYVGQSGQNVGMLFDLIKPVSDKIVVLWDEIDSIVSKRLYESGADQERSATINVMLRRFDAYPGISMAASNREDVIDPAMWRRFDMHLTVGLPGEDERFAILKRYAHPFDLGDEGFDCLVEITRGASPALLEQIMNGMKRRLVMAPLINKPANDPVAVFEGIRGGIKPPTEIDSIAYWNDKSAIADTVKDMKWPPERVA